MSIRRGRVLVAEDDPEMRSIIVETLRGADHDVHDVADGVSLLLELARHPRFNYDAVDVIVADLRMPLCSGLQALETIRKFRRQLPVVLLTAFADDELQTQVERLGGLLLDKPVSMERLREVVGAQLASPSRSSIR